MTDRELLEMIATQVSTLTTQVNMLTKDITELKEDQRIIKGTVLKIEQDHGEKLEALFDGYKQNTEKLDRIEVEVSKHEEIILRRIK